MPATLSRRKVLRALGVGVLPATAGCSDLLRDRQSAPTKLVTPDRRSGDQFGWSVATDGQRVIVGAIGARDRTGTATGAAVVFERDGGTWLRQARLVPDGGATGASFGRSVAIEGDTALVGADFAVADGRSTTGAAYVYERSNGAWTQRAELFPDTIGTTSLFGTAVALAGDTALVGARNHDAGGTNSGAAFIFERGSDGWHERAELAPADSGDYFGGAVALTGETALVGAFVDEQPNGQRAGSAYIFERDGSGWQQQARLAAADGDDGDLFGNAVTLSPDVALVGAVNDEDPHGTTGDTPGGAGAAYAFGRGDSGDWTQQAKLTPDSGQPGDNAGISVAVANETALVGAFSDDSARGSVTVFDRESGAWSQRQKLTVDDRQPGDAFGNAVALSNDTAIVGVVGDDDDAGAVYVLPV